MKVLAALLLQHVAPRGQCILDTQGKDRGIFLKTNEGEFLIQVQGICDSTIPTWFGNCSGLCCKGLAMVWKGFTCLEDCLHQDLQRDVFLLAPFIEKQCFR